MDIHPGSSVAFAATTFTPQVHMRSIRHRPQSELSLPTEPKRPQDAQSRPLAPSPQVRDLGLHFRPEPNPCDWMTMHDAMDVTGLYLYFQLQAVKGSVCEALKDMVRQSYVPVYGGKHNENLDAFLPINDFERIFCAKSIKSLVKEIYHHATVQEQVQYLASMRSRRRILATLLMVEKLELYQRFVDDGISDQHLPLRLPGTKHESDRPDFPDWMGYHSQILFRHFQSQFITPYFSIERDPHHYVVGEDICMPWSSFAILKEGRHRQVYKVQIYGGHHNFKPHPEIQGDPYFALKLVSDGTFDSELKALKKNNFKLHKTDHLVSLLLAIERGDDRYLLFECADGDLSDFWKKFGDATRRPVSISHNWAAEQCLGLATALKLIHGRSTIDVQNREIVKSPGSGELNMLSDDYGRHGDVKPMNILWYANRKDKDHMLVLSDLGSTRYHSFETRSNCPKLGDTTTRYCAPETDTNDTESRKCDIWSLGCVFLELCLWWLEGSNKLRLFDDECANEKTFDNLKTDAFYRLSEFGNTAEIKPAVLKCIGRLRRKYPNDIFAQRILGLVKDSMLVVDIKKRQDIGLIWADLKDIVDLLRRCQMSMEEEDTIKVDTGRHTSSRKNMTKSVYQAIPARPDITRRSRRLSTRRQATMK